SRNANFKPFSKFSDHRVQRSRPTIILESSLKIQWKHGGITREAKTPGHGGGLYFFLELDRTAARSSSATDIEFSLARFLRAENGTVFYGPQTRPDPRPTGHDRQSTAAQLGQIRHQSLANADRALSLR